MSTIPIRLLATIGWAVVVMNAVVQAFTYNAEGRHSMALVSVVTILFGSVNIALSWLLSRERVR